MRLLMLATVAAISVAFQVQAAESKFELFNSKTGQVYPMSCLNDAECGLFQKCVVTDLGSECVGGVGGGGDSCNPRGGNCSHPDHCCSGYRLPNHSCM